MQFVDAGAVELVSAAAGAGAGAAAAAAAQAVVGRLVDSTQADDRRVIRLVRARRLLYARSNMPVASFYSQVKHLWQEVADEMGWTVADVRRKWSHIRNSYSRHLRNELAGARTGRGRAVSRWYLADELEFLREHMATDTRGAGAGAGAGRDWHDEEPQYASWFATPLLEPKMEPKSEPDEFPVDENSSYFQFFRGLHAEYEELDPRRQRAFKRECLRLLHAMLDDQESQPAAMNLSVGDSPPQSLAEEDSVLPHS